MLVKTLILVETPICAMYQIGSKLLHLNLRYPNNE